MEKNGLGKRINAVRKDRGLTADRLSEMCNINATYLRQIEGGVKMPSLSVFIDICKALKISPDYLLQDECKFRINGAPFSRQRCKRLAPAVRYPFIACL